MTAYCWLATSGRAVFRTWLKVARFGPTDTSYHDMNQRPGVLTIMSSWNSPPRYQAESLGVRLIIAPRVGREHRPHLILLPVEPGDEEHLHRAAAVPVPLLVVRPHAPHPGPE